MRNKTQEKNGIVFKGISNDFGNNSWVFSPYVLSTSFSTHPKPLTWDKKPFQSRRVSLSTFFDTMRLPFFRHCETVENSNFFRNFFIAPKGSHQFFDILQQNGCSKNPTFYIFGTMRLTGDFKKTSEKFFPQLLVLLRAFVVSSCRKSGFRVLLSLRYGADLGRSRFVQV